MPVPLPRMLRPAAAAFLVCMLSLGHSSAQAASPASKGSACDCPCGMGKSGAAHHHGTSPNAKLPPGMEALGLSAEQKQKLEAVMRSTREQQQALRAHTESQLQAVLSPQQWQRWQESRPPHPRGEERAKESPKSAPRP